MSKKTIVVCASASNYNLLEKLQNELEKLGFNVILPKTARRMIKSGDFNIEKYKKWHKDNNLFKIKTQLMKAHFKEVEKADIVLVANYPKSGVIGYIGGNTLMEITVAFYLKKPIYLLFDVPQELSVYEEIYGVNPVFLNGNLELIN